MCKVKLLTIVFLSLFLQTFSQDAITMQENGNDLNVIYRNEMTGGIIVHTQGIGLNFAKSKHANRTYRDFFEFDLATMRSLKQTKSYAANSSGKGFYYGKLNSVLLLSGGFGFQKVLYEKANKERKSIEIRYSLSMGASLGLAKPVYLVVSKDGLEQTERYDPSKHSLSNIVSRASYFRGIDQTSIHPGGYAKFGLSFEYADRRDEIKAIETGCVLDAYPYPIAIMANQTTNPFFFTLYVKYVFGKRWF